MSIKHRTAIDIKINNLAVSMNSGMLLNNS